jgi:hypothetical protein
MEEPTLHERIAQCLQDRHDLGAESTKIMKDDTQIVDWFKTAKELMYKMLGLADELVEMVNEERGSCFLTFLCEQLDPSERTTIICLLTIREGHVSKEIYEDAQMMLHCLDSQEDVQRQLPKEFWEGFQATAPLDLIVHKICTNCKRPGSKLKCGKCRIFYCCKACQKDDWKTHKPNCK